MYWVPMIHMNFSHLMRNLGGRAVKAGRVTHERAKGMLGVRKAENM